jgi:hypothetical protein
MKLEVEQKTDMCVVRCKPCPEAFEPHNSCKAGTCRINLNALFTVRVHFGQIKIVMCTVSINSHWTGDVCDCLPAGTSAFLHVLLWAKNTLWGGPYLSVCRVPLWAGTLHNRGHCCTTMGRIPSLEHTVAQQQKLRNMSHVKEWSRA